MPFHGIIICSAYPHSRSKDAGMTYINTYTVKELLKQNTNTGKSAGGCKMTIKKKAMLTSISIKIVITRFYNNFFISVSSMESILKLSMTSTKLQWDKS